MDPVNKLGYHFHIPEGWHGKSVGIHMFTCVLPLYDQTYTEHYLVLPGLFLWLLGKKGRSHKLLRLLFLQENTKQHATISSKPRLKSISDDTQISAEPHVYLPGWRSTEKLNHSTVRLCCKTNGNSDQEVLFGCLNLQSRRVSQSPLK